MLAFITEQPHQFERERKQNDCCLPLTRCPPRNNTTCPPPPRRRRNTIPSPLRAPPYRLSAFPAAGDRGKREKSLSLIEAEAPRRVFCPPADRARRDVGTNRHATTPTLSRTARRHSVGRVVEKTGRSHLTNFVYVARHPRTSPVVRAPSASSLASHCSAATVLWALSLPRNFITSEMGFLHEEREQKEHDGRGGKKKKKNKLRMNNGSAKAARRLWKKETKSR